MTTYGTCLNTIRIGQPQKQKDSGTGAVRFQEFVEVKIATKHNKSWHFEDFWHKFWAFLPYHFEDNRTHSSRKLDNSDSSHKMNSQIFV